MRKCFWKALAAAMAVMLLAGIAGAEDLSAYVVPDTLLEQLGELTLPKDSGEFSPALMARTLAYNSGQGAGVTQRILQKDGLETVSQIHYDKAADDISHTCAFTIARGEIEHGGETRNLVAVVIRGTSGGEWASNFDFAPSHSNDTVFAENFLYCAEDVFAALRPVLEETERPLILATGHSRGAACANLLGVLLDAAYDPADVYVYTSATPTTVRGRMAEREYKNIFNLIHPCDVVPRLPMYSLGYARAGTDVTLPGDEATIERLETGMETLSDLVPDVDSYYTLRRSLMGAGEAEDGVTAYEMMMWMSAGITGYAANTGAPDFSSTRQFISPDSAYTPLIEAMGRLGDNDGEILMYHMPAAYLAGLNQMFTE